LKIFFTLTDGAGIRNFIHSEVLQKGKHHEVVLWCKAEIIPYVKNAGHTVVELPPYASTNTIEILRSTVSLAELVRNTRKFKNPDFLFYILRRKKASWRIKGKEIISGILAKILGNDSGVLFLRRRMTKQIQRTDYYAAAKQILKEQKPDIVVCTHQRSPEAVALVMAARALNIPTAAFIFSWDNLPKGTLIAEADHYLVWSDYMKNELLRYYPWVNDGSIHVTGTPQFLPYFKAANYIDREVLASDYALDAGATWICFSGDDELTSPYDPLYLRDLAKAVTAFNMEGNRVQIVFRPSPADTSPRYDAVLEEFKSSIRKIPAQWEMARNKEWGSLIPLAADYTLLCSIAHHCAAVFNVGSTMAIDFSIANKPSAYFRYNAKEDTQWDIFKVYRFIHFYTMKGLEPIYWLDSPDAVLSQLKHVIQDDGNKVDEAKKWQRVIVVSPLELAGVRMWNAIESITQKS
jgi:hypothetical protein